MSQEEYMDSEGQAYEAPTKVLLSLTDEEYQHVRTRLANCLVNDAEIMLRDKIYTTMMFCTYQTYMKECDDDFSANRTLKISIPSEKEDIAQLADQGAYFNVYQISESAIMVIFLNNHVSCHIYSKEME
jgi:hypothetical protein